MSHVQPAVSATTGKNRTGKVHAHSLRWAFTPPSAVHKHTSATLSMPSAAWSCTGHDACAKSASGHRHTRLQSLHVNLPENTHRIEPHTLHWERTLP